RRNDAEGDDGCDREAVEQADDRAAGEPVTPYAAVNVPYAVARRSAGTMCATAAGMIDSCTPMPSPQTAMPRSARTAPPRNTRGANKAPTAVSGTSIHRPDRSNRRPKSSDPAPLAAIATA